MESTGGREDRSLKWVEASLQYTEKNPICSALSLWKKLEK